MSGGTLDIDCLPQVAAALKYAGDVDVLICCAGASYPGVCHSSILCNTHLMSQLYKGFCVCKSSPGDMQCKRAGRFLEQDLHVFEETMELNYFGTLRTIKAFLPAMVKRRQGEVVLVSSAAAVCGT